GRPRRPRAPPRAGAALRGRRLPGARPAGGADHDGGGDRGARGERVRAPGLRRRGGRPPAPLRAHRAGGPRGGGDRRRAAPLLRADLAALARPRIGITTYHRERVARERFQLPASYVDAVRAAGGLPLLLPPGDARPDELLDAVDGLLLCGGGDIDPALFGGARGHEAQYATCAERDGFELTLVRAALRRRTPLLAICRGLQVLNVALGGDLHVHLPDAVGET